MAQPIQPHIPITITPEDVGRKVILRNRLRVEILAFRGSEDSGVFGNPEARERVARFPVRLEGDTWVTVNGEYWGAGIRGSDFDVMEFAV